MQASSGTSQSIVARGRASIQRFTGQSFFRALRYCWPYRGRILIGWACALAAAGLYVGSIGAIVPLFGILFEEPPRGVRYQQVSAPTEADKKHKEWVLEVSRDFQVVPDPAVDTVRVIDTSAQEGGKKVVYVHAGADGKPTMRIKVTREGLDAVASAAEEKQKPYAPALRWLADLLPSDRFYCLSWIMLVIVIATILRAPSGTPTSTWWVTPPTGPCWPCASGPTTTPCGPR